MSKAAWFFLKERDFNELIRLARDFQRQAVRCERAKAYVAGCAMAGAALEAALLAVVHLYGAEVQAAGLVPRLHGKPKPLLKWSLNDLVHVARGMNWLPPGLELGGKWDSRRAKIGDYAEALRQIRNLIHPARYLQDHSPSRVTKKYLTGSIEIFDVARQYLVAHVEASVRKQLKLDD